MMKPDALSRSLESYEREASNFQYHVLDEDIVRTISNLPVELDGVDTGSI